MHAQDWGERGGGAYAKQSKTKPKRERTTRDNNPRDMGRLNAVTRGERSNNESGV